MIWTEKYGNGKDCQKTHVWLIYTHGHESDSQQKNQVIPLLQGIDIFWIRVDGNKYESNMASLFQKALKVLTSFLGCCKICDPFLEACGGGGRDTKLV